MSEVPAWWWARQWDDLPLDTLRDRKRQQRISVVVPARDEERTVAGVVRPVVRELAGLVDEVVVVDGRSRDATAQVAREAGARVLLLPERWDGHPLVGKGGALWWAQFQTDADLLVLLDADVAPSFAATVTRLLTPLLLDSEVAFVKAAFDRPLSVEGLLQHGSGGRVTELLARPLINAWWPQLAGFVQPLSGELAVRRSLLERLPFALGYGLELGMLLDAFDAVGLTGMAQVDIGERQHRHHSDADLGVMAAAVLSAALDRRGTTAESDLLLQFQRVGEVLQVRDRHVPRGSLPPAETLAADRPRRAS